MDDLWKTYQWGRDRGENLKRFCIDGKHGDESYFRKYDVFVSRGAVDELKENVSERVVRVGNGEFYGLPNGTHLSANDGPKFVVKEDQEFEELVVAVNPGQNPEDVREAVRSEVISFLPNYFSEREGSSRERWDWAVDVLTVEIMKDLMFRVVANPDQFIGNQEFFSVKMPDEFKDNIGVEIDTYRLFVNGEAQGWGEDYTGGALKQRYDRGGAERWAWIGDVIGQARCFVMDLTRDDFMSIFQLGHLGKFIVPMITTGYFVEEEGELRFYYLFRIEVFEPDQGHLIEAKQCEVREKNRELFRKFELDKFGPDFRSVHKRNAVEV